jgi:hypothetical protein
LSYQNICFRQPTAEELRLAALRQLIFEEPVSRLARLKKTIQRQLARSEREKVKELSIYQLAELHGCIFAPDSVSSSSLISSLVISLALLLEDFRLYTPTAFPAFCKSRILPLTAGPRQYLSWRKNWLKFSNWGRSAAAGWP